MANTVNKVIKVAENEVGYLEKKSNASLDSKTANAGKANYTKYGKWIGANGDYWCASFISWLFYKAYGETEGKKLLGTYSAACETIRNKFIKDGKYSQTPKVGSVIFFKGSRHAGANHIGIVYKIDSSKVYTIEGNTSGGSTVVDNGGGVAKKSYSKSYSSILGYGQPKYDIENEEKKVETISATSQEVKKTVTATVKTNGSNLRMRKAGNTSSAVIQTIPNGKKVTVVSKGSSWTKCTYNGKTGYCSNTYLKF